MSFTFFTLFGLTAGMFSLMFAATENNEEEDVLTPEKRNKMSPHDVLKSFKDGNRRFVNGNLQVRKFKKEISETSKGQTPYAIVHSCIDSRVPVETIFDQRMGYIFSTRLAGNVINNDVVGGMEFATKLAGAKLVLVMGHTKCGAVKGAAQSAKLSHLTGLVNKIKKAEKRAKTTFNGEADANDNDYLDHLATEHVHLAIKQIREKSPLLSELESNGKLLIVGGMYDISNGKVTFFD